MNKRLLTETERKIMTRYLETGEKLDGFSVMLHRTKKEPIEENLIFEDLKLFKAWQAKIGK